MNTVMEKKQNKPFGLINIGNTCYMNTAIQTIVQIFSDYFISGEYHKKLSVEDDKSGSVSGVNNSYMYSFMNNFACLVASVQNADGRWTQKHSAHYIRKIVDSLLEMEDFQGFTKYHQSDSYEFLVKLIDLLSANLSYKISIKIDVKVDESKLDARDRTKLVFYKYLKSTLKKTSMIDEKLRGYFRASITCAYDDCDNCSEKFEPFLSLSLPIQGFNTLEECLKDYVKPIKLDEKNQWYCDKCKRKSQAEKKLSIWTTAEYMIVSYKRYANMLNNTIKDNRKIIAPFENLDMSPYVEDNKVDENVYDLCAITVHDGNMSRGHYVIARKLDGYWAVFNDSRVIPMNQENINNSTAYYLVYKRV